MSTETYLKAILASQTLKSDSDEMAQLRSHRDDVERILRDTFSDASPTIRYAGSVAKNTLIKESYDLDICCYFQSDEDDAGTSLEKIFNNVADALSGSYMAEKKTSAIRLASKEPNSKGVYFHIDVVPGRYTDETKTDCYLHQHNGDKKYLKTNLDTHIAHIKDSEVNDALRLLKLWRVRNGVQMKQFAFELLCIKLLKGKADESLADQLTHVWSAISSSQEPVKIEDPANPNGNDLMPILENNWPVLKSVAGRTLSTIEHSGWEAVFGASEELDKSQRMARLSAVVSNVQQPTKPWSA